MLRLTVIPLRNGEYSRKLRSTGPVPLIVFRIRNRVIEPLRLIPMQIPVKDVGLISFSGTTCTQYELYTKPCLLGCLVAATAPCKERI